MAAGLKAPTAQVLASTACDCLDCPSTLTACLCMQPGRMYWEGVLIRGAARMSPILGPSSAIGKKDRQADSHHTACPPLSWPGAPQLHATSRLASGKQSLQHAALTVGSELVSKGATRSASGRIQRYVSIAGASKMHQMDIVSHFRRWITGLFGCVHRLVCVV